MTTVKENQRARMQEEINRLNAILNNQTLEPRQFHRFNRRRSEILRKARTLKIKIHAV